MIALTQGLRESNLQETHGLGGLEPLGVVQATIYYYVGDRTDSSSYLERINKALAEACPDADYVLNVSLHIYPSGHPNNPERNCEVTGDAYRVET